MTSKIIRYLVDMALMTLVETIAVDYILQTTFNASETWSAFITMVVWVICAVLITNEATKGVN